MKLTIAQLQQIQEALLSAFPSKDGLRMMVRFALGEDLETIASGENQRAVVFNLLTWAESRHRVNELIEGAAGQNQGNPALQQLVQEKAGWPALSEDTVVQIGSQAADTPRVIPTTPLPAIPCPYRGLEPFEAEHAANYFGRARMVQKLVEMVGKRNFVAVVGPSGSGKSSLVRAGLETALRNGALPGSGDWVVELLRPGEDPLRGLALPLVTRLEPALSQVDRLSEARKLADRLRSGLLPVGDVLAALRERLQGASRLLLVFDQFEETFTLCTDEALRRAFLSALLTASETPWCSVLFTLRADFYGRVLEDGALGQRVDAGLVNVLPMNAEEARAAIEQPATNAGRRFEEGLAPRILEELLAEPGNLPLLEFALTALWERQRPDGLLTHAAYGEIGGVSGAIAQRATATLAGLPPAEQQAVRRVFTRLVRVAQPVEGGEDTKRRILLDELDAASQPLVRRLADARLLVTDRDAASGEETVEVAHEALIRGWGELRAWLNSDREFLLWRQRLRTILTTWLEKAQDAGALLRGVLLDEAAAWGQTRQVDLSEQEQAFISASQDLAQRERIEREAARQRELKLERDRVEAERQRAESQALAAQQLRQRAVWLAFALMLAVIVAGVALYYYDRAQRNADLANQKLADFRGEELFNEAQKLKEGELSDASAVQAVVEKLKAAHAADSHPDFDLPAEIENLLRTVATRWVKEGEKLAVTGDLTQAVRWYQAALDLQPPPDTPVYVHVPAGSFRMGSDNGENDEKPQHEIILKEFWILRSEVTNAQYRACVEAGVCEQPESVNRNKAKLAAWPVVNVSWQQAQQYASWKGGRLPTEAEWEKACRGRDGQIYPWGDQPPTPKLANFDYNEGVPVDVGSYPDGASPYGLYDMAGNVWEWTNSLSKDYPYNPQDGREDLEAEGVRTLRGGSFDDSDLILRCAVRGVDFPTSWARRGRVSVGVPRLLISKVSDLCFLCFSLCCNRCRV